MGQEIGLELLHLKCVGGLEGEDEERHFVADALHLEKALAGHDCQQVIEPFGDGTIGSAQVVLPLSQIIGLGRGTAGAPADRGTRLASAEPGSR